MQCSEVIDASHRHIVELVRLHNETSPTTGECVALSNPRNPDNSGTYRFDLC
jgi:hypothetical protein